MSIRVHPCPSVVKNLKPKIITRGALRFRLYTQVRPRPSALGPQRTYTSHILSYRLHGRRHRVVRADYQDLLRELDAAETAIANGQTDLLDFTHADKALLQRLRQVAAPLATVPLEILVAEAVEARVRARQSNFVPINIPVAVTALLDAKRAEKAGVRWVDDLDSRLGRFAREFPGPLHQLTETDLRLWLTRLNLSDRSYNNYRAAVVYLCAFARDRKHLPPDWSELGALKPRKITKGEEDLYTPEELRALLFSAEKHYPQHLPALAIMALAGCRHSELRDATAALDWKDIHFPRRSTLDPRPSTGSIHIREAVAKSNTGRRYVPMAASLAAWLEGCARPRGPVAAAHNLTNAFARVAAKARVTWKRNALRNSFISYRCALTQNVAQVAAEAGNSVAEIHKSYRKEIPADEAQRWFEIWPTKADVLPLFAYVQNQIPAR